MLKLIKPNIRYRSSYLSALTERDPRELKGVLRYLYEKHSNFNHFCQWLDQNFSHYLDLLKLDGHTGKVSHRPPPFTHYWLVEHHEFVGSCVIRQNPRQFMLETSGTIGYFIRPSLRNRGYGKKLLALALKKAERAHGLNRALICCEPNNLASQKVVLANHGSLDPLSTTTNPNHLCFWFTLKK